MKLTRYPLFALALLMLPASSVGQVVVPPCCHLYFGTKVLRELVERDRGEPLDTTIIWFRKQLSEADTEELMTVAAALDGYCYHRDCDSRFISAKNIVENIQTERWHQEDAAEHISDRWTMYGSGIVGAVIGALATLAATLFTLRRKDHS